MTKQDALDVVQYEIDLIKRVGIRSASVEYNGGYITALADVWIMLNEKLTE